MGGGSSRERVDPPYGIRGYSSPYSSRDSFGYQESSYNPQEPSPYDTSRYSFPPSTSFHGNEPDWPQQRKKNKFNKYAKIADDYNSVDQVTDGLRQSGLESSNLIVGIDFTKSNEWTGAMSFRRRCLHDITTGERNPYEQAISIIGRTLSSFDEDNLIPCYGFGDASTHDHGVFSFYPDDKYCEGFQEVLSRYREIVPHLRLAGPTSFAPIIEMAISIVAKSGGQYHVLLIIADGQVTRSVDTEKGQLSQQEQNTIDAIVKASDYPLSIVLVGVGDGPWDMMKEFDDNIPDRAFDNFQFVNFTEIMSRNISESKKEAAFSLAALMEIPSQYKATLEHGILGKSTQFERVPLPTPIYEDIASKAGNIFSPPSGGHGPRTAAATATATAPPSNFFDDKFCPICLANAKDMAFNCGHQTCRECGESLESCPICRSKIHTRIKLY